MFSSVSFGSTYKISSLNNRPFEYNKFHLFALKQCDVTKTDIHRDTYNFEPISTCTVVVPNEKDCDVEEYCQRSGIKYTKHTFNDLLNPANITKRIKQPKDNKIIAYADIDKLEQFAANQDSNLRACEKDYYEKYMDSVDYIIKSGDEIPATTLCITPKNNFNRENAISFIKNYGTSKLPCMAEMDFLQETDTPSHCMITAFKNLGMRNIPLYVDKNTYQIGQILGLFKKESTNL